MSRYLDALSRFKRDDKGMAALEYSLLLAVGAIASTTAVDMVGGELKATFAALADVFANLR